MAASLIRPNYATRVVDATKRPASEDVVGPLPEIRLAIPKISFQAPKNGLPVNPSPHTWVMDPAIQFPPGGRSSPHSFDRQRSPPMEQNEFISLPDSMPRKLSVSSLHKATQTDTPVLSRSSSQNSLECCHYCHGCQQRLRHRRSNTNTSISSSITSSSPNLSSPETPEVAEASKRSPSLFGRRFKSVLQRSNSRDTHKTSHETEKGARKNSASRIPTKKPAKRIAFTMVGDEDHWADDC